eukprot:1683806-Prymnesium_polylepis.1
MYLPDGLSEKQTRPLSQVGTHVGIKVKPMMGGSPRFQAYFGRRVIGTYDTHKKALAARNTATLVGAAEAKRLHPTMPRWRNQYGRWLRN